MEGHELCLGCSTGNGKQSGQRLDVRRAHRRGDSAPVSLLLLLVGLLILLAVFLPSNDAVEKAKQAADERAGSQQLPVVGVATES